MGIVVTLDVLLKARNMKSKELAELINITEANLSVLRSGKARAVRFTTLAALCRILDCQPGEILRYTSHDETLE